MSEPSNEQTETAQAQPSHGQKVAEWFASWTASQLATLAITSALGAGAAGAGGAYLLLEDNVEQATDEVKDVADDVEDVADDVEDVADDVLDIAGDVEQIARDFNKIRVTFDAVTVNHERMVRGLSDVRSELARTTQNTVDLLSDHRKQEMTLELLTERTQSGIKSIENDLQNSIPNKIEESREIVVAKTKELRDQIEALSKQFASVQEAIVNELKILVAQGSKTITNAEEKVEAGDVDEDGMEKIEKWIWMANYFIRSLAIPSEPGFFKDTSVVKSGLRKEMEGFDREKDPQTRLHHAKRALVIVEAVRRLAEGGRVP